MKKLLSTMLVMVMVISLLPIVSLNVSASMFAGGSGSVEDPYQISTAEQLNSVRNDLDSSYILINDIDLKSDSNWIPIGDKENPFIGSFDGNNHTVSNLYIDSVEEEYKGLFGVISDAYVGNVCVKDGYIKANAHAGAIVGYAKDSSVINNCHNINSSIWTKGRSGGIVGWTSKSDVYNCSNTGACYSDRCSGGIVGDVYSDGKIYNCSNTGSISGGSLVGSMTGGSTKADIQNCLNVGAIQNGYLIAGGAGTRTITNCFALKNTEFNGRAGGGGYVFSDETATLNKPVSLGGKEYSAVVDALNVYGKLNGSEVELFQWDQQNSYPFLKDGIAYNNKTNNGFNYKKHGWPILNLQQSFSYPTEYMIPAERYYDVFFDVKAACMLSIEALNAMRGKRWDGNCFGLSSSAILNYEGKINLKQYFSKPGDCLNVYGYDYQTEGYNALSEDSEVISLIERFQLSQWSTAFASTEVFKTGNHKEKIKQLIDYLNGDNPTPLLVSIDDKGMHAMVTDTSVKPQKEADKGNDGFYKIYLYDPNKPYDSANLINPLGGYRKGDAPELYVNPETGAWYYQMDELWGDTKNYLLAGNSTLRFYDVTKFSDKFLSKNLKIKPEDKKTYAYVSADKININNNAFGVNQYGELLTDNVEYMRYASSAETGKFVGRVILDTNNISVNEMQNTDVLFATSEDCISVSVDDETTYSVDTSINKITLNASENAEFDIAIDNESGDSYNAVRISGTAKGGVSTISVADDGVIAVDGELKGFEAEVTVESSQREEKTFKCTDIEELDGYYINNTNENTSFGSQVSDWAKEEVEEAYNANLIPEVLVGKDLTKKVDRAEFASIAVALYENLTGSKAEKANNPFNDISGNVCEEDILKAYNLNITTGTSATTFAPDVNITREQMATMLARAYKKSEFSDWSIEKDADYPLNFMSVQKFADDDEISDYAKESVYFMARWEIIKGVGDNKFAPKNSTALGESYGYATREQALIIALRSAKHL